MTAPTKSPDETISKTDSEFFRYPAVAEPDRTWGLYVTGGGYVRVSPSSPYPVYPHPALYQFQWPERRVLDEYQVLFITRGDGSFESRRGGKQRISAGSIVVTFPAEWHRYRPTPGVGWDQYWVGFRGLIADRIAAGGFLQPETPVLSVGIHETILSAFCRLLERLRNEPPGYQQLMAGSILEIVGAAAVAARLGRLPNKSDDVVQRAKTLLDPLSTGDFTMEQIAHQMGFSGAHFRRLFKRHTGMSPYQYQLQLRINRARELLHTTARPIREIAAELGFDNPYHFSAAFKRKTGMSPTQWRSGYSKGDPSSETF